MRLIDADALLEDIGEEPMNWTNSPEEIQEYIDWKRTVAIINNAPTIDSVHVMHWTNIDEAMPEIGVMVLMHRPPKFTAVMSLKYFDERFWWENHRREITEAYDNDYWMPLPEPPKEVTT